MSALRFAARGPAEQGKNLFVCLPAVETARFAFGSGRVETLPYTSANRPLRGLGYCATLWSRLNSAKTLRLKSILLLVSAIVIPLTIIEHVCVPSVLFYVLFPGMAVELLITGGHGGTRAEEAVAPFVGVAVNILVYSALFAGMSSVLKFRKKDEP